MSKKREHHKLFMVGANAPFQYTEAYKSLRTNLEFLSATDDCKTILVTSSVPNEGKSNVAIKLIIGHIRQTIIDEIASVMKIGLS